MAGQGTDAIEVLEEILGSLKITKDNVLNRSTELATPKIKEISTAPALAVYNENMPTKTMVPDPEQFDGDKTKFEDWWREICLFLKSNRVVAANNKITVVLVRLRGDVVEIYAQKKIDELEDTEDTQNWEDFVKEIKIVFSDKSKAVDTKQKIETFQQDKKHIADFIIKFEVLAIKAETDDLHTIFLLKKNIWTVL